MWFRRDLRLADNPALLDALSEGAGETVGLFVIDPTLWRTSGDVRRAWLIGSLNALSESLDGRLLIRTGDPESVVPDVAREYAARTVHIAADFGPYGRKRDLAVAKALGGNGTELRETGSAYAVSPGRVLKSDATPYLVFTPFYRAWSTHGWRRPVAAPAGPMPLLDPSGSEPLPAAPELGRTVLPPMGEAAATLIWDGFRKSRLAHYATQRDRPDQSGTSELSAHLKWGEIHPRTLLADLGSGAGDDAFRRQLAWRDFYADILARHPGSARNDLRPNLSHVTTDAGPTAEARLLAWQSGLTGYPIVDAGMRQLRSQGWMHNRVRMITASFLIKDLHLPWQVGARHFMHWLRDGDLASNQHGWQWVAGTGTDAAPYYRVFNPITQGLRFDPSGDYVRRYLPELGTLTGASAHEPWKLAGVVPFGYPERIVDHGVERTESLRRLRAN